MRRIRWRRRILVAAALAIVVGGTGLIAAELRTSELQARFISSFAGGLTFSVEPGAADAIRFPATGPYDHRLGHNALPKFIARLTANGFEIERQARQSPQLRAYMERLGFAPYHEKSAGGLTVVDRGGTTLFASRYPERLYADFEAIPRLVVDTLLFIENRELLDARYPNRNPAVEWDRFAMASTGALVQMLDQRFKPPGGSTLATQIEKFRHSPDGRTRHAIEKLRQMASASVRAYMGGPDTTQARRRIVVDYLNSTPLAASPSHGEVNGLGDGLWAWYGADFAETNTVLREPARDSAALETRALAFKQVLSLLLAQRRPSYYLAHPDALAALSDSHLRLLAAAGIIDPALLDAALRAEPRLREIPQASPAPFVERKAANAVRHRLLSLLDAGSLYALDRFDLRVETALDAAVQERVTAILRRLDDRAFLESAGLSAPRLIDRGDPARIVYSVTLIERGADASYVRVQADNLDQPFDVNEGAKLDLGSTAKLRTLITYLEIVAELHARYSHLSPPELAAVLPDARDELTRWAVRHLAASPDHALPAMLDAALARRYSASPAEVFFTGGGDHVFANFDRADNGRVPTVSEALQQSINLVFIRLMRDIVKYYIAEGPERAGDLLGDRHHPARQNYLSRFADTEGTEFLTQFYRRYHGRMPDEALALLASRVRPRPDRLAVIYRSVRPQGNVADLAAFLAVRLPSTAIDEATASRLYEKFAPDRFTLADRGYLAGIHPLELWLVEYLQQHPDATRSEIVAAGTDERQAAYAWLFRTRYKSAQDTRIRILLEEQAFARIHRAWQRLGYPFDSLVPSYATAIGSSADRPRALAELMGIIASGGIRQRVVNIERLHFAEATPYETVLRVRPEPSERVLAPEVAAAVRRSLVEVVTQGTARRVRGAFATGTGANLTIGGKTGTGDHRFEVHAAGGRLIESRVVDRNAIFVFFIGDRFYGAVTAHVAGPVAAEYRFTSALPVQLLKVLAPALAPLLESAALPMARSTPQQAAQPAIAQAAPPPPGITR